MIDSRLLLLLGSIGGVWFVIISKEDFDFDFRFLTVGWVS